MDGDLPERSTSRKYLNVYQILIHVMLVALAVTVVGLTQKNRDLRKPPAPEEAQLQQGAPLTAFSAFDLDGNSRLINFAQSDRDSLLFVFTTVCPACRENQPNWRMLYEQVKGRYEIVGISLNDIEATLEYQEVHDLPFPVVVPEDIRGFTTAHKIDRVPLTLQADHEGKVHSSWLGILNEDSLAQLTAMPAGSG